ncbi:MAG TPA: 23S rRNA (uracil(1939)-C(5))-methyltransferase RlmD [Acidobacteriota bacterium]|nr:23S rRNA (uracil(1939)-C(5))-methyltransferase RlmD [Acidobacteriota bacterium]
MVKKGQTLELEIESAAFEGSSVARHEGMVIFVRNGVPGDRIRGLVIRKKKRHAEAVVEEVLEPSQQRTDPLCGHFGVCGGCTWQNYDYQGQLDSKRRQVGDLLQRIGRLSDLEVRPTLASPDIYYYRNKMEFSFGNARWLTREEIESGEDFDRDFALGLHIPKRFDRILDLHECHLQSETSAAIVNFVRQFARRRRWSAYDTRNHAGFLRNLVIREGKRSGQRLVNLVTKRSEPERMEEICQALLERFPDQVSTFVNSVNETRSPVASGDETVYHGEGSIQERIGGHTFRIAPTTFFQPNSLQAEQLFGVARQMADLKGDEKVFDVYCGVGAVSLFLSDSAAHITGFDLHRRAIEDAARNALDNGVKNCRFLAMDAVEALQPGVTRQLGLPALVVLDPPRTGLHKDVAKALLESNVPRIVYISCNPATQARDLQILSQRYTIEAVQPVDMFPHTYHIENVVALQLSA